MTLYLIQMKIFTNMCIFEGRYFRWPGSTAGFIVASLGALVLPAHFIVEKASHSYPEQRIMKVMFVFLTFMIVK